jgi:hypothetical protein
MDAGESAAKPERMAQDGAPQDGAPQDGAPQDGAPQEWAPQECTLSPAARQARAAEFSATFAETVRRVERPEQTKLRLELEPSPASAGRVAALAAAETSCCSFFTFTLTAAAGSLVLDVVVPATQLLVLDSLAERAAANLAGPG